MNGSIEISEAEWQSLLSKHEESDNFVIDVIADFMSLAEEANQMDRDLNPGSDLWDSTGMI